MQWALILDSFHIIMKLLLANVIIFKYISVHMTAKAFFSSIIFVTEQFIKRGDNDTKLFSNFGIPFPA
jgi:hypothetical protein